MWLNQLQPGGDRKEPCCCVRAFEDKRIKYSPRQWQRPVICEILNITISLCSAAETRFPPRFSAAPKACRLRWSKKDRWAAPVRIGDASLPNCLSVTPTRPKMRAT